MAFRSMSLMDLLQGAPFRFLFECGASCRLLQPGLQALRQAGRTARRKGLCPTLKNNRPGLCWRSTFLGVVAAHWSTREASHQTARAVVNPIASRHCKGHTAVCRPTTGMPGSSRLAQGHLTIAIKAFRSTAASGRLFMLRGLPHEVDTVRRWSALRPSLALRKGAARPGTT